MTWDIIGPTFHAELMIDKILEATILIHFIAACSIVSVYFSIDEHKMKNTIVYR